MSPHSFPVWSELQMAFSGICSPRVMSIQLNLAEADGGRGFIKDNCGAHPTGIQMPSRAVFPLRVW